jgi:predicted Zn-dependent peptidase
MSPPHVTPARKPGAPLAVALIVTVAVAAPVLAAKPSRSPRAAATPAVPSAGLEIREHVLPNGMRLLLVPRRFSPTVAGGWVAHVGSANERPGITGISHLFEHMMFKGTHVVGTRDIQKDLRLIEEQETLREEMRAEESAMRAAQRRGEIDDMTKPESKTARYKELEARFDALVKEQRDNMVKNEFNNILQKNGASGINAFTNYDMTVYFETVPANKLELWFWLESDRLKNRVFREFYSERDVVYEERRLRTESTPTGKFQESFNSLFWDSSPYAWPVVGWPSDVANITKAQADEYYSLYYAPQNLTAVLVGDFDPRRALDLATTYLGSIPAGTRAAPEMITTETKALAEKRFYGEAETNPAVTIRWHTVASRHKDTPALLVLSEALNGPSGRLQKKLVLGDRIATSANSSPDARKYEGAFQVNAECKEGTTPEQLEQAIHGEIERLQKEPLSAEELQGVKNRYLASTYRQLGSNFSVMLRYAVADGLGSWRDADRIEREVQAVSAADVQRVAKAYFTKESRAVAIWTRKGGQPEDPALAALPPQAKQMVQQAISRLQGLKDRSQIQQMLGQMDQMGAQAPAEMKPAIDYIKSKAQARLDELAAAPDQQ